MRKLYPSTFNKFRFLFFALSLLFGLIPTSDIYSQTVLINPGSSWVVPAGVTSVKVEVWGGGGGGGAVYAFGAGGGGGGGSYKTSTLTVTPGDTYTITIGAGGAGGTVTGITPSAGADGGQTIFTNGTQSVTALPGFGGGFGNGGDGTGGAGGIGNYNGGAGGTSSFTNGPGGGGGAGNNGSGTVGSEAAPPPGNGGAGNPSAAPYIGGDGGAAISLDGNGISGNSPGGGGGGASDATGDSNGYPGGAGANGQIVLTFTSISIIGFSPSSGCENTTPVTITGTGFAGATAVTFGGTPAYSFVVNSDNQITAIPAAGTTGTIQVTAPGGTVTSSGSFTVNANNTVSAASSTPTLCINTALINIIYTTTGATGISNDGVSGANGLPAGVSATWAGNTITISGTPTASGTFNYSIPLTGGCAVVNATGTVTVTPANTASAASSTPTLCINTALTNITFTTTGATGIGTATGLPAGVSAAWAGNTITISGTPTASGTFNYSIPLTGGCGSVNATGTITVTAANTTSVASSTPTLCINTALTNITFTTTGATGIGTSTGLPSGVSAAWASNKITISGTPTASGTFNYTIPLTGGCGAVNATGTITVTAANTVGAASSTPTLCINTALTNITFTTTGATGIGVATGLPSGVSAAWASNKITISGTPTASGTFNYSIPLTGGCGTVNATGTITVTAANTASAASSTPTLCINTALTNITFTTTGATGISNDNVTGANGLPAGVKAHWAGNTITISGTPTASGTFNYTIPLTGGCGAVNATGTITVTAANTVGAASSTPTLCINTALTNITFTTTGAIGIGVATGLPSGVSAAWASNKITISGTPTASGTFNYTIPLTGGCGAVNATGTITVTAANTVGAASSTPTLCINTALTNITFTTTGATGIGAATGLPAGVSAAWASNKITISGTPTASGTFNYSIPLTGGCGAVNATGTITVTAANTASAASSTPTLCINTALTNITFTTTGATGISNDNVTGANGLPAGVKAHWAGNTITISGTPTASGTFNYTIPLTGGCGAINATGTITVNGLPTISISPSAPTICNGSSTSLTASGASTYTWSPGTGLSGTTGATVTASPTSNQSYTITGTDANGCVNTGVVSVAVSNPPPTTGVTICAGGAGSLTSSASCGASTPGTSGPNFPGTGASSGGSGTAWSNPTRVTANDGSSASVTGTGTAFDESLYATNFGFSIPATASITGIQVTIGRYASSASGAAIQDNLVELIQNGTVSGTNNGATSTNWPTVETAATYGSTSNLWGLTWTPALINAANFGVALRVDNTSSSTNRTAYVDYVTVTVTYTVPGSLNWYTVSSGGTAIGNGSPFNPVGVSGSGLPNTNTAGTYNFYAECAAAPGCRTATAFIINALPTAAAITGTSTICNGSSTTLTSHATGPGTLTYTWASSNTSVATVSNTGVVTSVGAGTTQITYTVTDGNTCSSTSPNFGLTVSKPTAGNITGNSAVCIGNTINLTSAGSGGTAPLTYTWSSTNTGVATVSATGTPGVVTGVATGTTSITYTVTDAIGCSATSSGKTISVTIPTAGNITGSTTVCAGSTTTLASHGSGSGSLTYTWNSSNPGAATVSNSGVVTGVASGTTSITYTVTDGNGCSATSAPYTVTVNPKPTAGNITGASNVCVNSVITLVANPGGNSPFTYTWTSSTVSVATVDNAGNVTGKGAGTTTIKYTVTDANGCTSATSAGFTVTVTQPIANAITQASGLTSVCVNSTLPLTSNATGVATLTYAWTSSNSAIATVDNTGLVTGIAAGTVNITYTVTDGNGCSATSVAYSVTVLAVPTGSFTATENSGTTPNDNIICKGDNVTFSAPPGYASYTFYVNGTVVLGPSTNNLFNTTTLSSGDQVTVNVANSSNCGATFGPITITVNALPTPTLSADKTTICQGDMVTFTAGGGSGSSVYTFELNGSPVQSGASNVYTNNTLNNNDNVTVILTDANKCSATYATPIVITVNSLPAGTLTSNPSPANVCAGSNITFTATSGFTSYEFFVSGVSQGASGSNTFSSTTLTNGSVVTVKATNSSTCSNTFDAVPVTIYALPTGTLAVTENSGTPNDDTICAGAPVTFTVTPTGASNYAFYLDGTGTALQTGTSNKYTTTTLANGDYITVTVSNANSCQITLTSPAITVNQAPTGSLVPSPSNTICAGSSVTFTADAGYANYNFKIGGTSVQNGTTNTYTSTSLADGNVVTVDVTNSNGCIATFGPVTMHVIPLPSGTLGFTENSGNAPNDGIICTGAPVTFTVTPTGYTNYNFLLNGASIQSGSSNVYTTSTLNNNDTVTVTVTNSNGCVALLNKIGITVNPLPTVASITGIMSVCVNSTTTLSDATTGGTWSSSDPAIATVDASAGVVSGVSAGTATINYTFTNSNGCSSMTSATVTVNPPPTVAPITGNVNICRGDMSQLTDATPGGSWSSSDPTIASVPNPTTGLVTGEFPGHAKIYYSVTNMNGCLGTDSVIVTVADAPTVAPITAASFDVCVDGTLSMSDATAGGVWSSEDPSTATINSAGVVTGVVSGNVNIIYTITTSCSQVVADTQAITVNAPPSATISYTGSPFCTTSGVVTVNQTGTTGGTYSYTGAGTLAIDPSTGTITPSASTGGTYSVIYTIAAAGGCSTFTTNTSVIITQAPSATISYSGGPFCTTSMPVAVNFTGTTGGAYSYTGTGTLVIDAGTGTITPSTSTGGTYTVIYTVTSAGCTTFTTNTTVTITTAPTATISYTGSPFCTTSGPVTVTQGGTTGGIYSYTGAGTLSLNTTNGTITPSTSTGGTYTVSYTIAAAAGCAAVTATGSVTITSAPTAVAGTAVSTCANSGAVNITAGSSATNQSSVLWTSSGTGTFTNANSLTTASYTPGTADITAGSVTLTLTANGNGSCAAVTSTKTLTISAIPTISVVPVTATLCQGSIQALTATSTSSPSTQALTVPSGSINVTITSAINYFFYIQPGEGASSVAVSGIPAGAVISNITVSLINVNDTKIGDLNINIKAPNGNNLNLVNRRGGSGTNFTNTAIAWNGGVSFSTGTAPFTGTFSPDAATNIGGPNGNSSNVTSFSSLTSVPNGTWTLYAEDEVADGSIGSIKSWSVTITYTVPVSNPVTWSPVTDLYTDAGATTPYTGQNLTTVYAEPSSAGTVVYTATATNASGCTNTAQTTLTVTPAPVVSISADYCIVPGKVVLTASSVPVATSYVWSTGSASDTTQVNVAGNYSVTVSAGGCPATGNITVAQNLVVNGDFSAGYTGFTTGYGQAVMPWNGRCIDPNPSGLLDEGLYAISTDGQLTHCNFWGHDHTTGSGNFMLVNGAGVSYKVWQETITVLPNTTYYFSAWGMSLNNAGYYASLQFNINGTQTGTIDNLAAGVDNNNNGTVASGAPWSQFYGTWTSGPTTTTAVISITDLQTAPGGNDFGIDDINFGTLSPFIYLVSAPGTDGQTPCINTPITPIVYSVGSTSSGPTISSPLPAGLTGTFSPGSGLYTISGTPTVAENYTYTLTTTGSCNPTSATGTIDIQSQTITLSSGNANPVQCKTAPVNIGFTLGGTATNATATGLPVGLTGSTSGNTFTISGTPTDTAGVYNYSIITSGTCTPDTVTYTITLQQQTITHNSGDSLQTICINTPIDNIIYTIGGPGTLGASVTGLPTNVTYNYNSGVLIISGTPNIAGTFKYYITGSGSCANALDSGVITVTPAATLTLTSGVGTDGQTVCINSAITNITYSLNNATNATADGLPDGVTGSASGGIFTITGAPTESGIYNYTITTTDGCGTGTATGTITVQSQTINLTTGNISPTLCQNTAMTPIVFTIGGTATGATLSGQPAGVSGVLSGNTFTASGTPSVSGTFQYIVTVSGSCATPAADTGTITVTQAAIGGNIQLVSTYVCDGGTAIMTLMNQVGTIVSWESSVDGGTTWTPNGNTTISETASGVLVPTLWRVEISNGCGNNYSDTATVGIHNYWTGGTSIDWNTASNWSDNSVPSTSCPDVYIPGGTTFQPTLSTGTATITNLHIYAGGVLTVTGATLQIGGTISNAGTFIASNGTIELNGTSAQTVPAATFQNNALKDLIISNSVGVTLGGEVDVYESLTYGIANGILNTGGFLTLKSTATQTAWIGNMTGETITGNVTVERYIDVGIGHGASWEFVATPTQGQTVYQSWMENGTTPVGYGTQVTSPGGAGFDAVSSGPSLKTYVYTTDSWLGIPNTAIPVYNQEGYMLFVRGDRSVSYPNVGNTTLRTSGALLTPANPPPNTTVYGTYFASIGNPYASAVYMSKISAAAVGVSDFYYVWDPTLSGSYGVGAYRTLSNDGTGFYVPTPSGGGGDFASGTSTVESGQAFFMQAAGPANGTVSFNESMKASGSNLVFRGAGTSGTAVPSTQLRANLYGVSASTSFLADGNLIQYNTIYSDKVDGFDAKKLVNSTENFGIISGGKDLVIERRTDIQQTDTIFYTLTGMRAQNYKIIFTANGLSAYGLQGFIEDSWLKTRVPLNMEGTTETDFAVTSAAGSYAANRFRIVFSPQPPVEVGLTFITLTAQRQDANIAVNWKVQNEKGMQQYEVEKSMDGVNFTKVGTVAALNSGIGSYQLIDTQVTPGDNYYRIRCVGMDGSISYSTVVEVTVVYENPSIAIYPNPITDGIIHLQFVNQPQGRYGIRLLNSLGQLISTKQIEHPGGDATENIQWNYYLSHGVYQLEVIKPDGSLKIIKVLY